MKLQEIKNKDLAGWQLMDVYTMALAHNLMGYFPLLKEVNEHTEIIVACLKREDLKRIWEKIPKRQVEVSRFNCLVHIEQKIILPVDSSMYFVDKVSSDSFFLITDDIEDRLQDTTFDYAFGLIGGETGEACTFPEE